MKAIRLVNPFGLITERTRNFTWLTLELRSVSTPESDIFQRFETSADELVMAIYLLTEQGEYSREAIRAITKFKQQSELIRRKFLAT